LTKAGELIVWEVHGTKTFQSKRQIRLHSALGAEVFWQCVESLPAGSSLFPMVGGARTGAPPAVAFQDCIR
jgi:hypothetical protein